MKTAYFKSIIATRLTKRMLIIYLCIYLFTLFLIITVLSPNLWKTANKEATGTLSLLADEMDNIQENSYKYSNTIFVNQALRRYLKENHASFSDALTAEIELELSSYVSGNALLLAATLEDMDHHYYSSHYFRDILTYDFVTSDPHYQKLYDYTDGTYYGYISPEVFTIDTAAASGINNHHVFFISRKMIIDGISYIFSSYYDMNDAIRHTQQISGRLFSHLAIINRYNEVLYSTDGYLFPEALADSNQTVSRVLTPRGAYYTIFSPATGWHVLVFSPYRALLADLLTIILLITVLYLISPVLYSLFLNPTVTRYLSPLARLSDAMNQYTLGEEVHLDIHTGDEIENLSSRFSQMTVNIHQSIEELKEKEHINAVTNFKLLSTQIDPHFIYNTMNIINIMARQNNTDAVVEINSALIKILRERLNTKLNITDTVEKELDTLLQYSKIMDYRYDRKILLNIDADPALMKNKIPKNILQPLVENSFYHGFSNLGEAAEGSIDILIYSIDDKLILEISDDGAGMQPDRIEAVLSQSYEIYRDKKPHIGIDNIRQRLSYLYGDDYSFEIVSNPGYGTTISITMPLL